MATTDLTSTSASGGPFGGLWQVDLGYNTTTALATDNDSEMCYHLCNTGSGTSNALSIENFSDLYASITSCQCRNRHRRSGVTNNATSRWDINRDSSWINGTLRAPVNSFYTDTITAPGGGWTDTIIDASTHRFYHYAGNDNSTASLGFDYFRFRVNYILPGGNFIRYALPFIPNSLAFLEDVYAVYRRIQPEKYYEPDEWGRLRDILRMSQTRHFDMGGLAWRLS
jgi:hypothetical protein